LAATLYHLLAGRPAFPRRAEESAAELSLRILRDPPPALDAARVPLGLGDVLLRALAKEAGQRPASAAALAAASGCRLLSIDYRLAPEHKFPASIEDAIAAVAFVVDHGAALGIDRRRIAVGGDSAGATLAAFVCQYAATVTNLTIAAQCLICPVLDFSRPWPSRQLFGTGYLIDQATWQADLADYLPEEIAPDHPAISPLCNPDLAGLPPAIIHTAEFDPMRDEGDAYAARLADAGVMVEHVRHQGMVHNFHALGAILPEAKTALDLIGHQVRGLLRTSATR